jgi:hypothetical protein
MACPHPFSPHCAAMSGENQVAAHALGQPTYFFLPFFFDFFAFLKSPPRASLAARVAFI